MTGFITIERKLWEHPLFKQEPMTEREAWMWMIAQAAWAETRHRVGGKLLDVPRGSFMATLREMQSAFMWGSDKRVRTFLKTLEKEGMIGRTTVGAKNAPKTHVTICKYEEYQSRGRTKDAPKTHERTHHGRTTDAVKNHTNKINQEDTNVSSTQEAAKYQDYLKAHPKPVESDAGAVLFSELVAGGTDPDQIIAAAKTYAETVKTWSADAKVQQSDNFLDPDRGKWREQAQPKVVARSSPQEVLTFWAEKINGTGFVAPSSINANIARALIEAELVTPEKMKQRGIAA